MPVTKTRSKLLALCAAAAVLGGCVTTEPGEGPDVAAARAALAAEGAEARHEELLRDGLEQFDAGDYAAARKTLRNALDAKPDDYETRSALGETVLALHDAAAALEVYKGLTASHADDAEAWQGLGLAYAWQGDVDRAEAALLKAVTLDNAMWRALTAYAVVLDHKGDFERADELHARAAAMADGAGAPWNNRGVSRLRRGDLEAALDDFNLAVAAEPSLAAAQINRRITLALLGRYDEAIAGAADDERALVLNNAGVAAAQRGDDDKARSLFVAALDVHPRHYPVAARNLELLTVAK
jgi:Tfp pilus assembly protein PilF